MQSSGFFLLPYSFSRSVARGTGTTEIPSLSRLLNAEVAKLCAGSLPEKISLCLRLYLQYTQPLSDIQTGALFFGNIKHKDVLSASTKKAFM